MNESIKPTQNLKWPSYNWIVLREILWLIWRIMGVVLMATLLGWMVLKVLDSGVDGLAIGLTRLPLAGWTILVLMVWSYWSTQLKGQKLKRSVPVDTTILKYFSFEGRRIFERTLKRWYRSRDPRPSTIHLLQALLSHRGTQIVLTRLDLNVTDIGNQLTTDPDDNLLDILQAALEYGISEQSRISWDDLLRGILSRSTSFKNLLVSKKITVPEAIAVVEWTRRDLYRRPSKLRHGLLHDLLTPKRNLNRTWSARPTPTLDRFSRNLTELARVGLLTSAKVRQEEVAQSIGVLSRSQENNIILVGEPGVGKTSIIGDIALKMIQGHIPALGDYKLISLDVGAMIGSDMGLQKLFARAAIEAAQSGNTILFVGNLDQFTKAKTSEGFDLSGILLSALERGGLQLIATSDPLNYKKYIENNENLARLFSRVNVNELDRDHAILVLEDLAHKVERRNRMLVTLAAVKSAVDVSQKYIHMGKLPDKAFDLLDTAAVYAARQGHRLVTSQDVEQVMSTQTNIPLGEVTASEKSKLTGLKDKIKQAFVGQEDAVTAVVEALKRARLGVSRRNRPIGNFLFLGPTGVGKTELAKRLAEAYFGDETKMIRLDMSEYQSRESAYRLFGAPPTAGDVALAGGSLTEAVKKTPFAVILLDEIEKAHPDILNVFLQVLDEGRMTDNLGNTIDFTHTMIIATSNAEAHFIQKAMSKGMAYTDIQSELLKLLIQKSFRPEFVNRFDGVIVFKPLTMAEIEAIARIKIASLQSRLRKTKDLTIHVSDGAIKLLARRGYDPNLGARPLERVIREKVEGKIANELLQNDNIQEITINEQDIE